MMHVEKVWASRSEVPKVLRDIRDKIDNFSPHDDYHMYDEIDASSYYRALDRVLELLNREILDHRTS